MNRALLFYASRSAINQAVKRLKDKRFLIGISLVAAYLFVILRQTRRPPSADAGAHPMFIAFLTLGLVTVCLLTWWIPGRDHPLALTRGEAQFLVPAPVSGRQLMLLKIVTSQAPLIWSAIVISFAIRSELSPHYAVRLVAAYLVLLGLYAQRLGMALVRTSRTSAPRRPLAVPAMRTWLTAAFIVAVAQAATRAADSGLLDVQHLGISFAKADEFPWSWVIAPFHFLVAPGLAITGGQFISSFPLALLLVALEFALVFRVSPDWERVGLARTAEERQLARRTMAQMGRPEEAWWQRRLSARLSSQAAAIVWKNLFSARRTQPLTPQLVVVLGIPVLLATTLIPPLRHLTSFASGMVSAWAWLLIVAGPLFVRNDLRLDLPKLRLLRTYPLSSREICVAEVASSATILTFLQLLLLALSTGALIVNPVIPGNPAQKVMWALAAAMVLPGINAINISAQNLFALMFPKWMPLGMARPSRSANPGQYYISLLISLGLFLAGIIVPALGALWAAYQLLPMGAGIALFAAALVAGAIALGEATFVIQWMARVLDEVDPAAIVAQ